MVSVQAVSHCGQQRGKIKPVTCDANSNLNGTGHFMAAAVGQVQAFLTNSSVMGGKAVH